MRGLSTRTLNKCVFWPQVRPDSETNSFTALYNMAIWPSGRRLISLLSVWRNQSNGVSLLSLRTKKHLLPFREQLSIPCSCSFITEHQEEWTTHSECFPTNVLCVHVLFLEKCTRVLHGSMLWVLHTCILKWSFPAFLLLKSPAKYEPGQDQNRLMDS